MTQLYTDMFKRLPPAHTAANRQKYLQSLDIQFDQVYINSTGISCINPWKQGTGLSKLLTLLYSTCSNGNKMPLQNFFNSLIHQHQPLSMCMTKYALYYLKVLTTDIYQDADAKKLQ